MRLDRLSLYLIALALALALSGCGSAPTSQGAMLSNAVHSTVAVTPTSSLAQPKSTVANPSRLIIPAIGVDAFIETLGMLPSGDMATPTQHPWEDVGWYYSGPHPGERGSAVIDGHLDRPGGYPAVFWRLRDMHIGDDVQVLNTNGKKLHFHVTRIALYTPQNAPIQDIFGNKGGTYLNLITCAGDWIQSQHQTTLRMVVFTALTW
jgi:LPXTG-site transpeptidase (sortase) family protein